MYGRFELSLFDAAGTRLVRLSVAWEMPFCRHPCRRLETRVVTEQRNP